MGVHFMGVHYNKQSFLLSRVRICGFWPDAAFLILALSGNLALRSLFRAVMGDDEERTEGIFYSAIAYEKLCQKPKPPLPELCTRPISRPIVYVP
jgi:hypothetical protein